MTKNYIDRSNLDELTKPKLKKDKNRTVKTVSGKNVPRRNTRWIKNGFYEMNVDCFYVNGQWHRINNGKIAYDYENNCYSLKENLKFGLVEDEGEIKTGYFSKNDIKNVDIFKDGKTREIIKNKFSSTDDLIGKFPFTIINEDVAHKAGFKESKRGEYFYHNDEKTTIKRSLSQKGIEDIKYSRDIYNTEESPLFKRVKSYFNNTKIKTSKEAKKISKLLGNHTFGFEFETSNGFLQYRKLFETGLIPLRDGSLNGFEYATVPLSKSKGLTAIQKACRHLNDRCSIDFSCSLHIHIGNIRLDELAIISLYMLCYQIQDELYDLVPPYKSMDETEFGKDKRYCKKLSNLSLPENKIMNFGHTKESFEDEVHRNFNKIFEFLTEGRKMDSKHNRKNKQHPIQGRKWNRKARYFGINLMPAIFSDNQTIEFRIHQGTLNEIKVINWLLICTAIVRYSENNISSIIKGEKHSLKDIIKAYSYNFINKNNHNEKGSFLSDYLLEYIKERQETFKEAIQNEDFKGMEELKNDSNYIFRYRGIENLF